MYSFQQKQARLDFVLVSECFMPSVLNVDSLTSYRSDHSTVVLSIKINEFKKGIGLWKFNNSLLKDLEYAKIIKECIQQTKEQYMVPLYSIEYLNDSNNYVQMTIPDQLFLEVLFIEIRGKTISYASFKKKKCKNIKEEEKAEIIEAFKSTSRYLDDLLNIDNPYFEGKVNRIYPPELQLNKANTADTEAPFLDLHLSISNGFVSSKIYDKRDDFDFEMVNFPFLDGDVPRSTSYGVYISQLIRFARVSSHVVDFNARNKSLTAKLLQQGYRYHKLRKTFSKFYRRHYELVSKFNVGLKTLLHQGLSEPEFYGDLVYKFKKIVGRVDFSDQFRKIIVRYKRIGYNINIMRQSACLVFNPITVNNFASLFNCTPVGRASDSMMAPT